MAFINNNSYKVKDISLYDDTGDVDSDQEDNNTEFSIDNPDESVSRWSVSTTKSIIEDVLSFSDDE